MLLVEEDSGLYFPDVLEAFCFISGAEPTPPGTQMPLPVLPPPEHPVLCLTRPVYQRVCTEKLRVFFLGLVTKKTPALPGRQSISRDKVQIGVITIGERGLVKRVEYF